VLEEFTNYVSADVNAWLNSNQGTMAAGLLEHRGFGTAADQQVWAGCQRLEEPLAPYDNDKREYGSDSGFKRVDLLDNGAKVEQRGDRQAIQSIWNPNGRSRLSTGTS